LISQNPVFIFVDKVEDRLNQLSVEDVAVLIIALYRSDKLAVGITHPESRYFVNIGKAKMRISEALPHDPGNDSTG